jgi:hypothetical protein
MDDKTVLSSIKRRPARVEEFLPLPITIERFYAGVHRRARRKGESFCSAMTNVLKEVGDSELDFLAAELERIAFGSDTAARDAAKREVLATAGYPDWNPPAEESREGQRGKQEFVVARRPREWGLRFGLQSGIFTARRRHVNDGN